MHIFRPCKLYTQDRLLHNNSSTIAVSLTMRTSKKDIARCLCRGYCFTKRFTQVSWRVLTLRYEADFCVCKISLYRAMCLKSRRRASIMQCIPGVLHGMLKAMLHDALSLMNVMNNLCIPFLNQKYFHMFPNRGHCSPIGLRNILKFPNGNHRQPEKKPDFKP